MLRLARDISDTSRQYNLREVRDSRHYDHFERYPEIHKHDGNRHCSNRTPSQEFGSTESKSPPKRIIVKNIQIIGQATEK